MATIDINRLIQDSIVTAQSSSPLLENDNMADVELSLKKVIFEDTDNIETTLKKAIFKEK